MPPTPTGHHLTEFKVILSLQRSLFPWLVNIDQASLGAFIITAIGEDDNYRIRNFRVDEAEYSPQNDDEFRGMLRFLVSKNIFQFTVTMKKLKAHSSYKSLKKVLVRYGIGGNNGIDSIPQFSPSKFLSHVFLIFPQDYANLFPFHALKAPITSKI